MTNNSPDISRARGRKALNLSEFELICLYYMALYTFLSIAQCRRLMNGKLSYSTVARRLRGLERHDLAGSFGGVNIGFEKAPKIYYIKKPGYEALLEEGYSEAELGPPKRSSEPRFSMVMRHRLMLVDMLLAMELEVKEREGIVLRHVFLDYRRDEKGESETSDYVTDERFRDDRITPDAAFILSGAKSGARLYLVELDRGTERINTTGQGAYYYSLSQKFHKYEKYLRSGRFREKYKTWGEFKAFQVLFVTDSMQRIENIRKELRVSEDSLNSYFLFSTYDKVMQKGFLGQHWLSRKPLDMDEQNIF